MYLQTCWEDRNRGEGKQFELLDVRVCQMLKELVELCRCKRVVDGRPVALRRTVVERETLKRNLLIAEKED